MSMKILAALAALFLAVTAHAAIDVNKATQAELEAVKGIGPSLSTLIVGERKNGEFKDWSDLAGRVKGVGERSARKFSEGGLTVQGKPYVADPGSTTLAPRKAGSRGGQKAAKGEKQEKRAKAEKSMSAAKATKARTGAADPSAAGR